MLETIIMPRIKHISETIIELKVKLILKITIVS